MNGFHPAVGAWFEAHFPDGPSAPQTQGWPSIRRGDDTLVAAPTGSGKTLAGFLVAIDALYQAHATGSDVSGQTKVVYVSPLKALAVDIQQNLDRPLTEIAALAAEMGLEVPPITVGVRTGDTTASARAAMVKAPPTILVTTPESLYLLVTAQRSRAALGAVETIIVDEIHALARDKRGSHLAITLERLEHLQLGRRPQRIGLSATQRPIEATARLLVGAGTGRQATIVDCGHARELRLSLELPDTELSAVASTEQFGEIVDSIAEHVRQHRTTLVFVNTRRMSERLAHVLGERLGPEQVAAHHGSLSVQRRQRTEDRLRAGDLRALVATASLELGIDIGPVELVCQVGSPRSIATFLQRVGRSNHSKSGVPEGVLYPMTRDELVECAALMAAVRAGRLDATCPPSPPLTSWCSRSWPRWPRRRNGKRTTSSNWFVEPPLREPRARRLRRRRDLGVGRHHHGPGKAHGVSPPRRRERSPAPPAWGAAGGVDQWGCDRRGGRLPRHRRARRHAGGLGQRGLRHRVHGRRRVPARHPFVAHSTRHPRRGPGDGRRRGPSHHSVLGGRSAQPHSRVVGRGVHPSRRRGRAARPTSAASTPPPTTWPARPGSRSTRHASSSATWRPASGVSACSPPVATSSSSGSSTKPVACSWSCTPPLEEG